MSCISRHPSTGSSYHMFYQTVKMRTPGLLKCRFTIYNNRWRSSEPFHQARNSAVSMFETYQRPVKIGLVTDCTKDCSDKTQIPLWKLKPLLQNISSENTGFAWSGFRVILQVHLMTISQGFHAVNAAGVFSDFCRSHCPPLSQLAIERRCIRSQPGFTAGKYHRYGASELVLTSTCAMTAAKYLMALIELSPCTRSTYHILAATMVQMFM